MLSMMVLLVPDPRSPVVLAVRLFYLLAPFNIAVRVRRAFISGSIVGSEAGVGSVLEGGLFLLKSPGFLCLFLHPLSPSSNNLLLPPGE